MTKINPYLDFNGNAEEAFNFYKAVFGGEFAAVMRWENMPNPAEGCEGMELSAEDKNKIMHISLPIGENYILMGSDALEGMGPKRIAGTNFSIAINPESREETDRIFAELSEGGIVVVPLDDAFWGAYFGMLTDKFGIQWLFNFDNNQN